MPSVRPTGCASQLPGPGREVDDRTPSAPSSPISPGDRNMGAGANARARRETLGQTQISPNILRNMPCRLGERNFPKYPLSGGWSSTRPLEIAHQTPIFCDFEAKNAQFFFACGALIGNPNMQGLICTKKSKLCLKIILALPQAREILARAKKFREISPDSRENMREINERNIPSL